MSPRHGRNPARGMAHANNTTNHTIIMNFTLNETRTRLTIHADADERAGFAEMKADDPDDWGSYQTEIAIMEPLICNSELQWINPADTGDLTDAPMIGITDEDETILERWAYMDYMVRSFCDDLLETGEAVFIS